MHRLLAAAWVLVSTACGDATAPAPPRPDLTAPQLDGAAGRCSAANCEGCCQGDVCQPGNKSSACGLAGVSCTVCEAPEVCQQSGSCAVPRCDALNCATGCCEATGACKPGTADAECGTGAEVCTRCDPDHACVENKCMPKGPSMVKVTAVSAKVTGSTMLVCGLTELGECDLFVVLRVGNATAQTTPIDNTNSPVWNEYLLTALETTLSFSFDVDVRDKDWLGSDSIGHCPTKVTAADLAAGKLVFDCGDAKQVTFSFEKI